MPRSKDFKQQSHERIRASAATELRRQGVHGLSIRAAMRNAGLTVGGFYAHFPSRADLIQDAFLAAAAERRKVVEKALKGAHGAERLAAFVDAYLADDHVANPLSGCPWATTLSELPRMSRPMREAITELFAQSAKNLGDDEEAAIATLALSFASIILMRAVTDENLRKYIASSAAMAVDAIIARLAKGGGA